MSLAPAPHRRPAVFHLPHHGGMREPTTRTPGALFRAFTKLSYHYNLVSTLVGAAAESYSSPPLRNGDSSASRFTSYSIPARSSSTKFATARRRPECAIQCAEYVGFGK